MHTTPARATVPMACERHAVSHRLKSISTSALIALLACAGTVAAQSTPLNDTGQITCYNATTSTGTVAPGTPDPEAACCPRCPRARTTAVSGARARDGMRPDGMSRRPVRFRV